MNKNQRRLGRVHQKRYEESKHDKVKNTDSELEEVFPPQNKRNHAKIDKFTTNKCCHVTPAREDFGQITECSATTDKYQNLFKEQYSFDPLVPETIKKLKELRKILCNSAVKVDGGSQYAPGKKQSNVEFVEPVEASQWQNIDNVDEVDKYIEPEKDSCLHLPENVHISETPRVKIIAKKFSRYKKNNIELRKLDEKVVCVEYDVFFKDSVKPKEKLRAFFSIRPNYGGEENGKDTVFIPTDRKSSDIKNKFNIATDDFNKLNEKEIEIIDSKIEENKTYLDDLKRILRRKQTTYAKRNKTSLDLMSLYEMAKRESPPLHDEFSSTNFLSKAELQEMKDLIIKNCASSVHGINRRTMKKESENKEHNMGVISQSIVAELWRGEGSTVMN